MYSFTAHSYSFCNLVFSVWLKDTSTASGLSKKECEKAENLNQQNVKDDSNSKTYFHCGETLFTRERVNCEEFIEASLKREFVNRCATWVKSLFDNAVQTCF